MFEVTRVQIVALGMDRDEVLDCILKVFHAGVNGLIGDLGEQSTFVKLSRSVFKAFWAVLDPAIS